MLQNSYLQSDSVLFQFILYEYLKTLSEAQQIERLLEPSLDYNHLSELFTKLAGTEQEFMHIFSWISDSGILTKLKNYTNLFSERTKKKNPLKLYNIAQRAWTDSLLALKALRSQEDTKEAIKKALHSIQKLTPAISALLPDFQKDENVLFFLLRYKEEFNHLKPHWIENIFQDLYPKGAFPFLQTRFQERGFSHLIPEIKERCLAVRGFCKTPVQVDF